MAAKRNAQYIGTERFVSSLKRKNRHWTFAGQWITHAFHSTRIKINCWDRVQCAFQLSVM